MKDRRFTGYVDASRPSKSLRALEPRLGRNFIKGEKNRATATASETIKARLISELGTKGYEALLQELDAVVKRPARKTRPSRRRRRRSSVNA